MKKAFLLTLFISLQFFARPAPAQVPSPELSSYEELRYGSDLSRVPREPYQTEFRLEGYQARPYIPPEPDSPIRPGASAVDRRANPSPTASRLRTRNNGLKTPQARVRARYQTRTSWSNEQRKISERSRQPAPSAPLAPGSPASLGTPGAGQPSGLMNRR